MAIFFEIVKAIFFGLTIFVGIFYLRSKYLGLNDVETLQLQQLLMPGYMVFCGIMLGYLIATLWIERCENDEDRKQVYIKSFIIGVGIGLCLALAYILL